MILFWLILLQLIQAIIFVITIRLFVIDYRNRKVASLNWFWWIITLLMMPLITSLIWWINTPPMIIPYLELYHFKLGMFFEDKLYLLGKLWLFCLLAQTAVLVIYLIKRKKNTRNTELDNVTYEYDMPGTCPHCKNPNTKGLQVCEWCGREVF